MSASRRRTPATDLRTALRRTASAVAVVALAAGGLVAVPSAASAAAPLPIAAIQGTGPTTPYAGQVVTTTPSRVTAVYGQADGAEFRGFVIQTPGTGGRRSLDRASDAVYVFMGDTAFDVAVGDLVTVTGTAGEFPGNAAAGAGTLTQIAGEVQITSSSAAAAAVRPVTGVSWEDTARQRESLESMLYSTAETFTVNDTFPLGRYGELGLSSGRRLAQPTDVAPPGSARATAQDAYNEAHRVNLDDGSNRGFARTAAFAARPVPHLTRERDVRLGDTLKLTEPVIVDFRNGTWKFNPTEPFGAGDEPVRFVRQSRPERVPAVGGAFSVASFNVLNYFTTLGDGRRSCRGGGLDTDGSFNVTNACDARGAWDAADLKRQQDKIVAAVNELDASVVGLLEIENSAKLGEPADEATRTLVDALNAAAGRARWAHVPSSDQLQPVAEQDFITNALIYQPAEVRLRGKAYAAGGYATDTGPFGNARTPIAASFVPAGGGSPTLVAVNHFKSKGSPPASDDPNADRGDGQGAWNAARVAQSRALLEWLPSVQEATRTDAVALVGDFNAYTQEDPMRVLYEAGYGNAARPSDSSYTFDGLAGSLDHILLNQVAARGKRGSGVWNINSVEPELEEYSAYRTTAVDYYRADPYRSSDHDPVVVGLRPGRSTQTDLTLLNINDFHGRISTPETVRFFGTVEQQRAAAGERNSLLLSAGDNIGGSLFTSFSQNDQPTLDVLNAADLAATAVGNHEFDQGYTDLTGRVDREADWTYLGANVYRSNSTGADPRTPATAGAALVPALPEYRIFRRAGVRVGVIGVVTEETPSLVSAGNTAGLAFGDPVKAVNRVARQLTDGRPGNGEADVLVAEYHEGAALDSDQTAPTLEQVLAQGGLFARIVTETSAEVDAIFTGHTHARYAWQAPVPGDEDRTRPVLQTGSYGGALGKVTLTLDRRTDEVVAASAENLAPTTTPNADLVAQFPRVADISRIVKAAIAEADLIGRRVVGQSTAEITRAFTDETGRDNRAVESTLSNLVAQMYREQVAAQPGAALPPGVVAQIGVQNPGGVRDDLDAGDVTFAEAASVLPFANSLYAVDLTGAQLKTLLEQQWQRARDGGALPSGSRPYLQLGLSDNVTYTYDPARTQDDRVTAITVDGVAVDPTATYRVATNSFLAQGGDNFWVFESGRNARDTGLVDLDAWVDWIGENSPVSPSYAKHAVAVSPQPGALTRGGSASFTVSALAFASENDSDRDPTVLTASLNGTEVGRAPVADGQADVTLTVPADAATGSGTLVLSTDTGTAVTIPVTVT